MSDQPTERVDGQFYIDVGNKVRELEAQLAAEREVGHNTAVALAQQIIKLEDQLAATGTMGDQRCQRCGTKFEVDGYCENGHMKPISDHGGRCTPSK